MAFSLTFLFLYCLQELALNLILIEIIKNNEKVSKALLPINCITKINLLYCM